MTSSVPISPPPLISQPTRSSGGHEMMTTMTTDAPQRSAWAEYGEWFLGLTDGARDETKARYGFVYGDLRRVHRSALIACQFRAAEWRHKAIELAAHELLQHLDATSA